MEERSNECIDDSTRRKTRLDKGKKIKQPASIAKMKNPFPSGTLKIFPIPSFERWVLKYHNQKSP